VATLVRRRVARNPGVETDVGEVANLRTRDAGVPCKVCESHSTYVYSMTSDDGPPTILDVFRCSYCKLIFIGTRISSKTLASAYESQEIDSYYDEIGETTSAKVMRALGDICPGLTSFEDPAVLDVGCGFGHLLEELRNRYPALRAAGTELPGRSADACRAKGLRVFTGGLHEVDEQFSIVMLLDVAEHLPAPTNTFEACNAVMDPGGWLYIHTPRTCFWDELSLAFVRIPGLCELARLWLRSRVSIFHLQLWTDEALEIALSKAGFEVIYFRRELGLSWPLRRYVETYVGRRMMLPSPVAWVATELANVVFVRLGTLRNKAVCLAEKRQEVGNGSREQGPVVLN
jgi:SAM-dependent methyltransferase